jgi:hypothetical protein
VRWRFFCIEVDRDLGRTVVVATVVAVTGTQLRCGFE